MSPRDSMMSSYGVRMPRIIYGTAWKKQQTEALVSQALSNGFRGIDTACQPKHYHEAGVGAAVASAMRAGLNREDVYLQTKFTPLTGHDPLQVPYDAQAPLTTQVAASFAMSLRNLQTNYVDCLLLHSPLRNSRDTQEAWQAMQSIFDSGGAKQLGICNCYQPTQFEELCRWAAIKPAVVQNRFYAETHYDREIRAFCRQHNIIYQSFWTLTANPHLLAHNAVKTLAVKYQCTAAQILFRCLTQLDIVPLTGTTSPAHTREDLAIFALELTDDECESMSELFQ